MAQSQPTLSSTLSNHYKNSTSRIPPLPSDVSFDETLHMLLSPHNDSTSATANAPAMMMSTHSGEQNKLHKIWTEFSEMDDTQRDRLFRGLIERSSQRQMDSVVGMIRIKEAKKDLKVRGFDMRIILYCMNFLQHQPFSPIACVFLTSTIIDACWIMKDFEINTFASSHLNDLIWIFCTC